MSVARIISGGQTGADRGGLDAAIQLGIMHGGHCPRGRRAEDGPIPISYQLVETDTDKYPVRTRLNIVNSDATIVISMGSVFDRGTGLTLEMIEMCKKPFCKINIGVDERSLVIKSLKLRSWLDELSTKIGRQLTVNVAGPRESRVPGLQVATRDFLIAVLDGRSFR